MFVNSRKSLIMCNCRYIATVEGEVSKRHLIAISEGTVIEGVHCTPDSVELLPKQPDLLRPRLRIVVFIFCCSLMELFKFPLCSVLLQHSFITSYFCKFFC